MSQSAAFREGLLTAIPNLRAFAVSLCGSPERADDLVQETMVKAWAKSDSFEEGTNLNAWLFTILRNEFYSQMRKRKREVEDADGSYAEQLMVRPSQHGHMDLDDFKNALSELAPDQREALVLVGASGFAYEEAAEICNCAVGTIKSRVSRARKQLAARLNIEDESELVPEQFETGIGTGTTG